jgi:hypothetical protein
MDVAMHAVNEDELVHGPIYWLNRMFFHVTFGIQERDMRGEILLRQIAKTLPRHRDPERSSKRPQPVQSLVPEKYERAIAGPASKADERSNKTSNGGARTSAAASRASRAIGFGDPPKKNSEM